VVPKGAKTARLKTELDQTIEEEELQEFTRVYTDGSIMEDRVRCFGICGLEEIKSDWRNKRAYSTLKLKPS
jgi:hypothetical protein